METRKLIILSVLLVANSIALGTQIDCMGIFTNYQDGLLQWSGGSLGIIYQTLPVVVYPVIDAQLQLINDESENGTAKAVFELIQLNIWIYSDYNQTALLEYINFTDGVYHEIEAFPAMLYGDTENISCSSTLVYDILDYTTPWSCTNAIVTVIVPEPLTISYLIMFSPLLKRVGRGSVRPVRRAK